MQLFQLSAGVQEGQISPSFATMENKTVQFSADCFEDRRDTTGTVNTVESDDLYLE